MVLQVIMVAYGYFSSVKSGALYIGFGAYPLAWIIALVAAVIALTTPKWRDRSTPLFTGTLASVVAFFVAFFATRIVFRGLIALIAAPLLHASIGDSYGHSFVAFMGLVGSLLACPVAAIVSFAKGYDYAARASPPPEAPGRHLA
jgi:hypothetical protein